MITGQGAQWPGMSKELIVEFPSFRKSIQELDGVLQKLDERPTWTLMAAILETKDTSNINHVTRSQPVCTAVQIALVDLLAKWGAAPKVVIGHSSGEIAAAYAAGRLTSTQAITVAYYRGYVVGKSASEVPGAMMAASLSSDSADAEIENLGLGGIVQVACINSNESVTLSGDEWGVKKLSKALTSRGVFARELNTNGRAYHSHHMKPMGQEYEHLLQKNLGLPVGIPAGMGDHAVSWISSVNAAPVGPKILPSYWRSNLESPVLFADAAEHLLRGQKIHLIELGPHSALEMPLKQIAKKLKVKDGNMHYNSAIIRNKDGVRSILNMMGQLYLYGHRLPFKDLNHVDTPDALSLQGKLLTDLPPYPWTYDGPVLWNEGRQSRELRNRKHGHHDLLGLQMIGGNGIITTWRNMVKVKDVPWLGSHKLGEDTVFPAAGYIAMAIEGFCQVSNIEKDQRPGILMRNFNAIKAMPILTDEDYAGAEVFTTLRPLKLSGTTQSQKWYDFEISTYDDTKHTIHATGLVAAAQQAQKITREVSVQDLALEPSAPRNWYDKFASVGLNFGPHFQTMKKIETDSKRGIMKACATVDYSKGGRPEADYILHPTVIDSMLQTALVASSGGQIAKLECRVPTAFEEATFIVPKNLQAGEPLVTVAASEKTGPGSIRVFVDLVANSNEICGQLKGVSAVAFQGVQDDVQAIDERHPMMKIIWKPDITKLGARTAPGFSDYLTQVALESDKEELSTNLAQLAELVCIQAHKQLRVRILELCDQNKMPSPFTRSTLNLLRADAPFPRYASYTRGHFDDSDELWVEDFPSLSAVNDNFEKVKQLQAGTNYDLIICSDSMIGQQVVTKRHEAVGSLLGMQGVVIGLLPADFPSNPNLQLSLTEIAIENSQEKLVVGKLPARPSTSGEHKTILVGPENATDFDDKLRQSWSARFAKPIEYVSLSTLTPTLLTPGTTVICTVELYEPLLATLTEAQMSTTKVMTDNAASILWVHGGDNMDATRPSQAMVTGFFRSLVLEQPSLRFFTYDIDDPDADQESSIVNVLNTLDDVHD